MGDAEDAEQATRIAMAVYATMIRDDPDSRARLRVTPEQALNFPNYYCLASWIANGTRAPSFMGQTYPLPDVGEEWAEQHLAAQDERVGPYPEQLESTLSSPGALSNVQTAVAAEDISSSQPPPQESVAAEAFDRAHGKRRLFAKAGANARYRSTTNRRQRSKPDSPTAPSAESSAAGHREPASSAGERPTPDTLRELAFLDRINEIGPARPTRRRPHPAAALRRGLRDPRAA